MTTKAFASQFISLSVFTLSLANAQAATPIASVVVYGDRAQVTRSSPAQCSKGSVTFPELPSTLDPKTLRATLRGGKVLGITWKTEVTGPRAKAKALNQEIKALTKQMTRRSRTIQAAHDIERKLRYFRNHAKRIWGRQARRAKPPVQRWDKALSTLRQEGLAAIKRRRLAESEKRVLSRKRRELYRQREQLRRQERRTTYKATVLIRCQGQSRASLSYMLPGASWRIAYQARANVRSHKLTLVAQAIVSQGTGEDWKNVKLAVSTANIRRKNDPPTIRKMRVSTYEPRSKTKILTGRFEVRKHLKTASQAPGGSVAKDHKAGQRGKRPGQGLAMQLNAVGSISIPGDGREIVVTLAKAQRKADFAFETAPKLFPFIYYRVSINNPFAFPMLPGPIALFRDNAFIGNTHTKLRAPKEPVRLSMGVNNQFQVRRWVKKESLKEPSAFVAKKRLFHRYLIEVGNWTNKRRKVVVLENVPVAQVKEIEVKFDDKCTKPTHFNKKDGIVRWELTLPPRSKKKIWLAYTVYVPKDYVIRGYSREP